MLDDASQLIASVNQSNLTVRMTFSSSRLQRRQTSHSELRVPNAGDSGATADDGQLLNFPHDEELRRENPFIVSDLPKARYLNVMLRFPERRERISPTVASKTVPRNSTK